MKPKTMAEKYVVLRLRHGLGCREASRKVGFSAGSASPQARALYEACTKVRRQPGASEWLQKQERELAEKLSNVRTLLKATQLVEYERETRPE